MAPNDQRAAMRAALLGKTEQSYKEREDSGQFKSIFVDALELKFWKCGSSDHMIDIIPYQAGPNDRKTPQGEWTYVLIIFVHYGVGVNQDAYICPARNFNEPCPICEYREDLRKQEDYDEDLVKSLNPKKRSLYNVIVYDNEKEQAKGIQLFDVAHWFMERHLVSMAKTPERAGQKVVNPYIAFADPEEGKTIAFERKGTGMKSDFIGHKFVDRDYIIPPEMVGFPIDAYLYLPTYEEIKNAFYGGADELTPSPEKETDVPNFPPPEMKAPPAPAPLKARRAMSVPAPTETSAPVPSTPTASVRMGKKEPVNPCPVGGKYGEDCEKLEACNGCPEWEPCSAQADILAAGKAPAPTEVVPPTRVAKAPVPAPRPQTPTPAPRPPIPTSVAGPRRGPFPKK